MSKADLCYAAHITPNTMTELRRDGDVSMEVLGSICQSLNKDFGISWNMYRKIGGVFSDHYSVGRTGRFRELRRKSHECTGIYRRRGL
ncbi:MAG: helix-turn-helix transcriptional regulator [Ruminococcus flavefaciens]|nr:helix-turn-helix transcriptional regulator [Ruminococcus flavefaciens]